MKALAPKPIPFKIPKSRNSALMIQVDRGAAFYGRLHYHPEHQITTIVKGSGVLFAGNQTTQFEENDVFLIGPNVPHLFKSSEENNPDGVEGTSIFFDEKAFGSAFFQIQEMEGIQTLLKESKRVLQVKNEKKYGLHQRIQDMKLIKKERLIIAFLSWMAELQSARPAFINTDAFSLEQESKAGGRLNDVLDYTFLHYKRTISIQEVAKTACLSRSQFSHFFKLQTGKSYGEFLRSVRIENACMLLKNEDLSIDLVCAESGFNNLSNFIRQFKREKGLTPAAFRRAWAKGKI